MEQGVGNRPQSYEGNITIPHTLHKISSSILERQNSTRRIRDTWIPQLFVSLNHFVKLYIPSVEDFVLEWRPSY